MPEVLADLLLARGAQPSVVSAAKDYKCVACLKHKKPNQVAPLTMPQQQGFNEAMQADVFYLKPSERKHAVLSIVDVGTKYMAACWVPEETSESYSKALEKVWIRHFGAPRILITDEGRPWLGGAFESSHLQSLVSLPVNGYLDISQSLHTSWTAISTPHNWLATTTPSSRTWNAEQLPRWL